MARCDTQSPEHALVTALALLSERSPVAKDPRIIFGSSLGSDTLEWDYVRYRSEAALSALSR